MAPFQNKPRGREPRASKCDAAHGSFCCLFVVFVGSDNRHAKALEAYVRKHPGSFLVDLIDTNLSRLSCEV